MAESSYSMAESSIYLTVKARDLLATPNHEGLAIIVNQLFMHQDTVEHQSARALYEFCLHKFSNCLTLQLLKVYRYSSSDVTRFRSIYLLSQAVTVLRNDKSELAPESLYEIKPLLVSCLKMQETNKSDIKILGRIVSFVAYNVLKLDNSGWDELSDCILSLAITEPVKAFHVFINLPPVNGNFIYRFMQVILEKAYQFLFSPTQDRVEDWSLALETVVKMGIQILGTEMRFDLIRNLLSLLVKSASDLVEKGMEQILLRGLDDLERLLSRDYYYYHYNKNQCLFVSSFMFKIRELGTHTKTAAKKINRLVNSIHNPAIKFSPSLIPQQP